MLETHISPPQMEPSFSWTGFSETLAIAGGSLEVYIYNNLTLHDVYIEGSVSLYFEFVLDHCC